MRVVIRYRVIDIGWLVSSFSKAVARHEARCFLSQRGQELSKRELGEEIECATGEIQYATDQRL